MDDIKVENEEEAPLLDGHFKPVEKTLIQKAISQTFQSSAHLANLLPTGSVLAFQLLSPIFTNQGACDPMSRGLTAALIAVCGLSCFVLSFSDSFKDQNGKVCYGFATIHGLCVIDGNTGGLAPEVGARYRLRFMDLMHGLMSVMVFAAVTLFDEDVVKCFYPSPSDEIKELLTALPLGLGVLFSMLFVVFPTQRHGIGFPVTTS